MTGWIKSDSSHAPHTGTANSRKRHTIAATFPHQRCSNIVCWGNSASRLITGIFWRGKETAEGAGLSCNSNCTIPWRTLLPASRALTASTGAPDVSLRYSVTSRRPFLILSAKVRSITTCFACGGMRWQSVCHSCWACVARRTTRMPSCWFSASRASFVVSLSLWKRMPGVSTRQIPASLMRPSRHTTVDPLKLRSSLAALSVRILNRVDFPALSNPIKTNDCINTDLSTHSPHRHSSQALKAEPTSPVLLQRTGPDDAWYFLPRRESADGTYR